MSEENKKREQSQDPKPFKESEIQKRDYNSNSEPKRIVNTGRPDKKDEENDKK